MKLVYTKPVRNRITEIRNYLAPGLCSRIRCEGRKRNGSKGFIEEE